MKKKTSILILMIMSFMFMTMFGQGFYVKAETEEEIQYTVNPQFSSDGPNDSHEKFANQGLKILANDKGNEAIEIFNKHKNVLLEYCDKPDSDEKQYLFAYHFYDPYTGKNFLPGFLNASHITGLTKFQEHMTNAVSSFNNNEDYSIKELGRAIHFLEDINVPHHSANLIAVFSTHSMYEKHISENNEKFFISKGTMYEYCSQLDFNSFCTEIFNYCAKNSYSYKDIANTLDSKNWDIAAYGTVPKAQEAIAALLYRFAQEVTNK